jgi:multiple sugar transport system permease protein
LRTSLPQRRLARKGLLFTAPYVVLLLLFGITPAAYGLYQAFIVTKIMGDPEFSLWQNFADVLGDYRLGTSAANVALYMLTWLPALLILVFALALAMDAKRSKFAALTRFLTYVPGAITGSAAALLWLFMFSPTVSPIGPALRALSGTDATFVSDETMPLILAIMGISAGAGGWVVILFGALTGIPSDLIESAQLDGATAWQTVWHVKLPMIRSYVAFVLIVSLANGFQVFVEPTVIRAGAPAHISQTWSVNQLAYVYATGGQLNYGRASALSILLLAVCIGLAVIIIKRTNFYSLEDN